MRGSRRSCVSTRAAVASVTRAAHRRASSTSARKAASRSRAPVRARSSSGVPVGEDAAVAEQQQLVAAVGLVHHVARDEQRRAACGEPVERRPRGRGAAPGRGRRSARRARAARGAEQRGRERDAGALAAGEPVDDAGRPASLEADGRDRRVDAVARHAEDAREVAQVLAHGEVAVDRRRLRDVRRRAAQRRGARPAAPSTRTVAAATICTPTIARMSVDLPLPLGPSSPVTRPASTSTREIAGSTTRCRRGTTRRSRIVDRRHRRARLRSVPMAIPSSAARTSRRRCRRSGRSKPCATRSSRTRTASGRCRRRCTCPRIRPATSARCRRSAAVTRC